MLRLPASFSGRPDKLNNLGYFKPDFAFNDFGQSDIRYSEAAGIEDHWIAGTPAARVELSHPPRIRFIST
jgi:hypothetical protein